MLEPDLPTSTRRSLLGRVRRALPKDPAWRQVSADLLESAAVGIGDLDGNGLTLPGHPAKGADAARDRPIKPLLNLRICFDSTAKRRRGPISDPAAAKPAGPCLGTRVPEDPYVDLVDPRP